jgi:hypothetical protein
MKRKYQRKDFIIKDLVFSVSGGNSGATWLPGPDDETPPSPISPVASVMANMDIIELVRATMAEALKTKNGFESIAKAFVRGEADGNPAIRSAIEEIGSAVVASAAYSAMGSGAVGLPNPECGGSSLETIPTPITPVVHLGRKVHRVTELPRLKQQLAIATEFIDKAVAAQAPSGEEVGALRDQLAGALKRLG